LIAVVQCSLSINGGITFGPAVPIYTIVQCDGLHGHLRAAPDVRARADRRSPSRPTTA